MTMLGCSGGAPEPATNPIRGRLEAEVLPNPVVAVATGEGSWQFPFEVVLRESGGVEIEIEAIRIRVTVAGIPVSRQLWDSEEIRRRGYGTVLPPGGMLQYAFTPVRAVANAPLLEVARGEVEIEVVDRLGNRSSTVVTIGVTLEGA